MLYTFFFCTFSAASFTEFLDGNELEEQERFSRNANHHDHDHGHDHGHGEEHGKSADAKGAEDIFERAARAGIRLIDGKDREGAYDIGNDLDFLGAHHNHSQEVEKLRELLNSGLSLGKLFWIKNKDYIVKGISRSY